MKKVIIVIMAIAMVAAFTPKANAADSAQLGLQVTFASSEPITIATDPYGPFEVKVGSTLEFKVIAEDKDTPVVDITPSQLPEGAEWIPVKYLGPTNRMEGTFRWTPKANSNANEIGYVVDFKTQNADGEVARIEVNIKVINSIISIDLEGPNPWVLNNVKLGDKISDNGAHRVVNTGNVPVDARIKYGPLPIQTVHPGLEQGLDTYVTFIQGAPLDAYKGNPIMIETIGGIKPGVSVGLDMVFGAPTKVSDNNQNMSTTYEVTAYPAAVIQK